MSVITCRICLAYDVRMYTIINSPLQQIYEKLTNVPFQTEDDRPKTVCYICCYQLRKCQKFMQKSLKSDEILTQVLSTGLELNRGTLDVIKKQSRYVSWCLQMTPIEYDLSQETEVKDEVEVKVEEVKIEEDTFGQPEYREEASSILASGNDSNKSQEKPQNEPIIERNTDAEDNNFAKKAKKIINRNVYTQKEIVLEQKNRSSKLKSSASDTIINNFSLQSSKLRDCNNKSTNTEHTTDVNFNSFICDMCERKFNFKRNLELHIRQHYERNSHHTSKSIEKKPFRCDTCMKIFTHRSTLKIHYRIHSNERPYECDLCKKRFNRSDNLKRHYRIHTKEKIYKCDICNKRFNCNTNFKRHYRIHTNEKPYKCDICKKCFTVKSHLNSHYRIHTKEKPYKCDICKKGFTQSCQLKVHYRIHTKEKPYKCDICKKGFTQNIQLKVHYRMHTKEKPYT